MVVVVVMVVIVVMGIYRIRKQLDKVFVFWLFEWEDTIWLASFMRCHILELLYSLGELSKASLWMFLRNLNYLSKSILVHFFFIIFF